MTKNYKELVSLIEEKADLSDFFKQKINYKNILMKALDYDLNTNEVIQALSKNLPLDVWFDKEKVSEKINERFQFNIFEAGRYAWCMIIPEVRELFSPEEKGRFLHAGLALKNHKMAYHATLDDDWERELPDHLIEVEVKRLSSYNIKRLDGKHLNVDYLEWFTEKILPKFSEEDNYLYLLCVLNISVGQLRGISELVSLTEIGFEKNNEESESITKVYQDLKDCISYLKDKLSFEYWTDEFKNEFTNFSKNLIPAAAASYTEGEEIRPFAEKLKPIIQYKILNNNLEEKTGKSNKKKSKV